MPAIDGLGPCVPVASVNWSSHDLLPVSDGVGRGRFFFGPFGSVLGFFGPFADEEIEKGVATLLDKGPATGWRFVDVMHFIRYPCNQHGERVGLQPTR